MRIISGRLKGRALGTVPEGVRPTGDRVRESLFASLGSVEGLHVLDLFAGTGALGLEAYSRGASSVLFVDRSKRVIRALRARIKALDLELGNELRIAEGEAGRVLRRVGRADESKFDLVFVDPPYADGPGDGTLEELFSGGTLNSGARVVVERPKRHPLPRLPGVRVTDERRYGDTMLTWLEASELGSKLVSDHEGG